MIERRPAPLLSILLPMAIAPLILVGGCTARTEIRIAIETDIPLGAIIDELSLEVTRGEETIWTRQVSVDGTSSDALESLVSPPDEDLEPEVEILVVASGGGTEVIRASRRSAFLRGHRFTETICLLADCSGVGSRECSEGRCDGSAVDGGPGRDADEDTTIDGGDADGPILDADGDGGPCMPSCYQRLCGDDGCGGQCGPPCPAESECNEAGFCVRWIEVEPGGFQMGSLVSEVGRVDVAEGLQTVALTRSFELLQTEVGQGWFMALMGYNPATWAGCGATCPVESLTWHEAALFCNNLSLERALEPCYACTGGRDLARCSLDSDLASPYECEGYRLPTEAEWEYAARAGTSTATYNGDLDEAGVGCEAPHAVLDPVAWFCGNAPEEQPHDAALLAPNDWLFYDMLGNISELTFDYYADRPTAGGNEYDPWGPVTGDFRVARGGSMFMEARANRAAARIPISAETRMLDTGFRAARTLP